YRFKADDKGRAAALTECGGYSLRLEGNGEAAKEFGYKKLKSREELMAAYRKLYEQEIIPAIPKGLSAVVYTQLSDVEGETNGLLTYDRDMLKVDGDAVREINSRLTYAPQGESES
ncbi:MAG: glycoside hydrolase family 2, partial [Clostridia bacterium]|nr:glycoside hydrolase family 2 [Clostridia bacterium]